MCQALFQMLTVLAQNQPLSNNSSTQGLLLHFTAQKGETCGRAWRKVRWQLPSMPRSATVKGSWQSCQDRERGREAWEVSYLS